MCAANARSGERGASIAGRDATTRFGGLNGHPGCATRKPVCLHWRLLGTACQFRNLAGVRGRRDRKLFFGNVQSGRMGRRTGSIRLRLDWALHRDRRSFRAFHSLVDEAACAFSIHISNFSKAECKAR